MNIKQLGSIVNRRDKVTRQVAQALAKAFPVGSSVKWYTGDFIHSGTVEHVGFERLRVRNSRTGKVYWVELYRVLEAMR